MSDVDAVWTEGVGIREYTDVDIEERRNKYTKISDPDEGIRRLAGAVGERDGLTVSEVLDRALRVAVARVIDDHEVSFRRDDYDVALLVPPRGWLARQTFSMITDSDVEAVDVDTDGRSVGFSTSPTAFEMAQSAVDAGVYETLTELVAAGLEELAGR